MQEGDHAEPIINIIGDSVALGPIRRDLIPTYQRWINDWEVVRTLGHGIRPMTLEAEEGWFSSVATGSSVIFQIYERATLRPIGTTSLEAIDHQHRTATFGLLIGEKDCWGKGYGTETARLILDYGFNALGLHNIMLQVYAFNERGVRAYLRAGYKEIGRRRQALVRAGVAHDIVLMDCLATEFHSDMVKGLLGT
jgi:RimJ/RimL family protein N-acetyltransferase